jgi:lipid-A-disaccharide synthase
MRIALAANGPGEFSGWVRPLLRALYARDPALETIVFFVPDDYATGREALAARAAFPQAVVVEPQAYLRFALGASVPGVPSAADVVLYLGGDLMHAARLAKRLGARLRTYKFARKRYAGRIERAYALDEENATRLARDGIARDRIEVVGNLAIDGALAESSGAFSAASVANQIVDGGILVMPGSRRREVANLIPFFVQAGIWMYRFAPGVRYAFGLSPFTTDGEVQDALERGGDPRFWGARGRLEAEGEARTIVAASGERFPVVRDALRYATRAAFVLTIPGTKCIELAALGVPALVCSPMNAPELIVINGPLTYLDRVPLLGALAKRGVVRAFDRRFRYLAQPNMDAGEELQPELRGALMPARVAQVAKDYLVNGPARAAVIPKLLALYAAQAGAAERVADSLLAGATA